MATLGSDSLLQESLRMTVLISRSIGPEGPGPSRGLRDFRVAVPAKPAGSSEPVETGIISAIPPKADLRATVRQVSPCLVQAPGCLRYFRLAIIAAGLGPA